MSKVAIDQEELKYFIGRLNRFNEELGSEWRVLRNAWRSLEDSWRDSKREEFKREWEKVILQMDGYLNQAGDFVQFLSERYDAIDKYFGH